MTTSFHLLSDRVLFSFLFTFGFFVISVYFLLKFVRFFYVGLINHLDLFAQTVCRQDFGNYSRLLVHRSQNYESRVNEIFLPLKRTSLNLVFDV